MEECVRIPLPFTSPPPLPPPLLHVYRGAESCDKQQLVMRRKHSSSRLIIFSLHLLCIPETVPLLPLLAALVTASSRTRNSSRATKTGTECRTRSPSALQHATPASWQLSFRLVFLLLERVLCKHETRRALLSLNKALITECFVYLR